MPNSDFRITVDALDHPKLVKLRRLAGDAGIICLVRLWGFTARYHPRGDLNGMTDEDIEVAAKWEGEPSVFFSALMKLRLLDEMLGAYSVHDWEEHNGYAFHSPERTARAKHAAGVRWGCGDDASSNAQGNATRNAPSPTPAPTPNPKKNIMSPPDGADGKLFDGAVEKKTRKYLPIEQRQAKTEVSRLVKYWHECYLEKHGIAYSGDIKKMGGQAKNLLRRNSLEDIGLGILYLLDQKQTQYVRHTWDHFIDKASYYITTARDEGWHYPE